MSDLQNTAKNPVKAAQTTMRLIEVIQDRDGARITELAEELDYPKSSIHNYVSTLREEGYVIKEGDEYYTSLQFLEVGSLARRRRDIYDIAKPKLTELARETGELVNLLVEEKGKGVYLYREEGENAVQVDSYTGQRVFLHNTALGKSILAYFPEERVQRIADTHGLPATTDRTTTELPELFDDLEEIRQRGVAFDDEERLKGLRCVAAPILTQDNRVLGAISISGPASRFSGEFYRDELPDRLRRAANVIELDITHG